MKVAFVLSVLVIILVAQTAPSNAFFGFSFLSRRISSRFTIAQRTISSRIRPVTQRCGQYRRRSTRSNTCRDKCGNGYCNANGYCICHNGWTGTWCDGDINECETSNGGCAHICLDNDGSFECSCNPGYILSGSLNCNDIDECAANTDGCAGSCTNTDGSFSCSCPDGKVLSSDNRHCDDVNECDSANKGGCEHVCDNLVGSFSCSCNAGYELDPDGRTCNDIDECVIDSDNCEHNCENTDGSFYCSCHNGYTLDANAHSCNDQDECSLGLHSCNQICKNTAGGYTCSCNDGYNLGTDEFNCEDHDECKSRNDCEQVCRNNEGSFSCSCNPGYVLNDDGKKCDDFDECSGDHGCEQYCTNTEGSFECQCREGYNTEKFRCHDVNECDVDNGGCQQICSNEPGSYRCECTDGYKNNGAKCYDVDECAEKTDNCSQTCSNTEGSFSCSCDEGYSSDGEKCFDIDECATEQQVCTQQCKNNPGSYECSCRDGYSLREDGVGCDPLCTEECQHNGTCVEPNGCQCTEDFEGFSCEIPVCHPSCLYGDCTQRDESNECECMDGFEGGACDQDINECEVSSPCEQNCANIKGSYYCSCNEGYILLDDDRSCTDVNECEGEHACDHNCQNVVGSYECNCAIGWTLATDDRNCEDIDECTDGNHGCEHICINNNGSYQCACEADHYLGQDGKSCYEIVDEWTLTRSGCRCYFDLTRTNCSCCIPGACQCDARSPNRCVQCGYGDTCGIGIDEWASPCFFNNSKLGKLVATLGGQCDGRGRYLPRQRDRDGNCWCVDRFGRKLAGTEGQEECANLNILTGWTRPGSCQCDHDKTRFDCACCKEQACQCREAKLCVQCGVTFLCSDLASYYSQFDFAMAPFGSVRKMTKTP